jgi:uncharacterized membrane protein YjgN (DUF898 family)
MEPDLTYAEPQYSRPLQNLPNATAVLVLGILSIVLICCYAVPSIILGVIALILASKDMKLYNAEPAAYTIASYKNVKAGKTCAVIGLILFGVALLSFIIVVTTIGFAALSNPSLFNQFH